MENKGNEKGKVYFAHGSDDTLRPFMTDLLAFHSQHGYHTLGKEGDNGRLRRKDR